MAFQLAVCMFTLESAPLPEKSEYLRSKYSALDLFMSHCLSCPVPAFGGYITLADDTGCVYWEWWGWWMGGTYAWTPNNIHEIVSLVHMKRQWCSYVWWKFFKKPKGNTRAQRRLCLLCCLFLTGRQHNISGKTMEWKRDPDFNSNFIMCCPLGQM